MYLGSLGIWIIAWGGVDVSSEKESVEPTIRVDSVWSEDNSSSLFSIIFSVSVTTVLVFREIVGAFRVPLSSFIQPLLLVNPLSSSFTISSSLKKSNNKIKQFALKKTSIRYAIDLKYPDLLKISGIILSYHLADCFELKACLAGRFLCSQNINKYSNKPVKGCERIIRRF